MTLVIGAPFGSNLISQRNAPGAISGIALLVRPPRPSVGLVVGFSGMTCPSPFDFLDYKLEDGNVRKEDDDTRKNVQIKKALDPQSDRRLRSLPLDTSLYRTMRFIKE